MVVALVVPLGPVLSWNELLLMNVTKIPNLMICQALIPFLIKVVSQQHMLERVQRSWEWIRNLRSQGSCRHFRAIEVLARKILVEFRTVGLDLRLLGHDGVARSARAGPPPEFHRAA